MKYFKSFDLYGHKVGILYNKNSEHKTFFGSFVTLVSTLGCIIYFGLLFRQILNFENSRVISTESYRDLLNNQKPYHLTFEDLDFALLPILYGQNRTLTKQFDENSELYLSFYMNKVVSTINYNDATDEEYASYSWDQTPIEFIKCTKERFPKYVSFDMQKAFCPKDINFTIQGNIYNKDIFTIEIGVLRCTQEMLDERHPGKKCKSESEIEEIIPAVQFYMINKIQYFDIHDYRDNPIKNSFKAFMVEGRTSTGTNLYIKVNQNNAILKDSILSNGLDQKEYHFTNLELQQETPYSEGDILYINFFQDERTLTVERTVFTIVDALSLIGGFYGFIASVCYYLTDRFQKIDFYKDVIEKVYYTNETKAKASPSTVKIQEKAASSIEMHEKHLRPKISFRHQLLVEMRRIFGGCGIKEKKMSLYDQGLLKIQEELDVVKIIKTFQLIRTLSSIVLSKKQFKLLKFDTNNFIGSSKEQENPHIIQEEIDGLDASFHNQDLRKQNTRLKKKLGLTIVKDKDKQFDDHPSISFKQTQSIKDHAILENTQTGIYNSSKTQQPPFLRQSPQSFQINESIEQNPINDSDIYGFIEEELDKIDSGSRL